MLIQEALLRLAETWKFCGLPPTTMRVNTEGLPLELSFLVNLNRESDG